MTADPPATPPPVALTLERKPMRYPIFLGGDHAEFEAEHANTPPHERPDWPLPSFDARDWAAAFVKHNPGADEGNMIGWFANALMRGFDEATARAASSGAADPLLPGLRWASEHLHPDGPAKAIVDAEIARREGAADPPKGGQS